MSDKPIYKVIFIHGEKTYELYAKSVYQGEMYGFIIVEEFLFGEKSAIVVDPSEDKIRTEFEGVQRSFLPIHEVIRIDQVKRRGVAKIVSSDGSSATKSNVAPLYTPHKE
jgi:hypothetical protein